jgi:hypothetical protein
MLLKKYRSIHKKFYKKLEIELPKNFNTQQSLYVIYGNKEYGRFETKNYSISKTNILSLNFFPPGYKYPLTFTILNKNKEQLFSIVKNITSPAPKLFTTSIKYSTKGRLSTPFYISSFQLPALVNSKHRSLYISIFNRFGEIVWLYIPRNGDSFLNTRRAIIKHRGNFFSLLLSQSTTDFEEVNLFGEINRSYSANKSEGLKGIWHHDYIYLDNENILALGKTRKYIKNPNNILEKPKLFIGDVLHKVNLKNNTSEVVWNAFDLYHKIHSKELTINDDFNLKNVIDYQYSDCNSLDMNKKGEIAISLRKSGRIIILNKDYSLKSIIGKGGDITALNESDNFVFQHDVRFHNDKMTIFDNSEKQSRAIEIEFLKNKKFTISNEFHIRTPIWSHSKGLFKRLENNNYIGYFRDLNNKNLKYNRGLIAEFTKGEKFPIAQMELKLTNRTYEPYRILPLAFLQDKKWINQ